jgi:hypothetical protein
MLTLSDGSVEPLDPTTLRESRVISGAFVCRSSKGPACFRQGAQLQLLMAVEDRPAICTHAGRWHALS